MYCSISLTSALTEKTNVPQRGVNTFYPLLCTLSRNTWDIDVLKVMESFYDTIEGLVHF